MIDLDLPEGVIPVSVHHQLAHDLWLALLAAEGLPADGEMLDGIGLYIHVLPADSVNTLATRSTPRSPVTDRQGRRRARRP
jgi:hypothetical protein